jgi:YegS/Rv2252/BmrU family lipid kinase
MRCKRAYLVINPRAGQDMTKLTDVIAVFSAAGWKTDNALVEYGGHATKLAAKAAAQGYDLIIAHGGDGTLNEVVNGVMQTKGHSSVVGILPGGTANQWAHEIGMPLDPVQAALTLVNSDAREVDIGYIEVQALTFPGTTNHQEQGKKVQTANPNVRDHFLLTAGLGIDAAVISHTSKSLKQRIGRLAFDVAAAKVLPTQHAFPVEICVGDKPKDTHQVWRGEALQLILGNTRRYADVVELTPDAYIDDGVLDLCVITAESPLSAVQQATSLLLRRKPDDNTTEYVRNAHLSITVPASIQLQVDGSAVDLTNYLSNAAHEALKQAGDTTQVMVTYRVDTLPHALQVAIPRTYDNTLFQVSSPNERRQATSQPSEEKTLSQQNGKRTGEFLDSIEAFLENEHKVTVVGVAPIPEKAHTYIVAGSKQKQSTNEIKPAAVRIDDDTLIIKRTGETCSPDQIEELQAGTVIMVEGKESKRGVIRARRMVI